MGRVLVWGLSNRRAGTEMVINAYASCAKDIDFDFLGYDEPIEFRNLFENTRNRAFAIPSKWKSPVGYYWRLNRFMREHAKEYDALWFNLNNMANIDPLVYAKRYGISRRIVHSHNSSAPPEVLLKAFSALNAERCRRLATERWACSGAAGAYVFGDENFRIVPNLIDSSRCSFSAEKRMRVREYYGVASRRVVGTIGRLSEQKNPLYLVEVFCEARKSNPDLCLMFVGEGELSNAVEKRAKELGVWTDVMLVGPQSDIQGYLSAFDVFAFPSLYEGLPLALLEAQFNGLPCVVSDAIPEDAVISTGVAMAPLGETDKWARELLECSRRTPSLLVDRANAYDLSKAGKTAALLFR